MPECNHLCLVISRVGYQVLIDTGALSMAVAVGLVFGLLTGQCETTLLLPLSSAQGSGPEGTCPMAGCACAHPLPCG